MLDLVFLVLMLIVLINAVHGKFMETVCNVAMVVGIIAAIIGLITAFLQNKSSNGVPITLNLFLLVFAVLLPKMAQRFVKLYEEKERENMEKLWKSYSRDTNKNVPPVYTDDDFDDPELRFGKGGYTDNNL